MDSSSFAPEEFNLTSTNILSPQELAFNTDAIIIDSINNPGSKDDAATTDLSGLYSGYPLAASKVIAKLNELLATDLPEGIESLKPEDHTAEKTADMIASQSTAFFGIYAKQHPEMEGEELLNSFMDTIRGGIKQGYDEAFDILEGFGAFDTDGVQSGVEQTAVLIEEKLVAFEEKMRKQLAGEKEMTDSVAEMTSTGLQYQAGVQLNIAA